ncbi:MAG: S-layer homology domain-containing protein [Chloroflexota bacterium]|nr:S-layer homology domain-containing protein [Chloroflexota bacterium]
MQRKWMFVLLVLAGLVLGGLLGASAPAQAQLPQPGVSAPLNQAALPDGTRKLPPPAGSSKPVPADPSYQPLVCAAPVVNVSQTSGNQSESFVVINRTNPANLVAFSNATGNDIFRAYSFNSGATWTHGTVATGAACCDAQAAFDSFGNLFVVYINAGVNQINVILSTDGGVTFGAPLTVGTGSVDQPSIAVGNGSVWVDWNSSGNMMARGAPVTGLGTFGPFNAVQTIPGGTGSFGGITVGPGPNGGKVMLTYQNPTGGQGPATIFVNVDADGLGAGGFGPAITATSTNVGGFDFIPAQSGRSIDSEAGLVWDATGGPFNGRAYLVYTEEPVDESNDTEIYLRTSTNDGATWSAPVRVNDDPLGPIRSQFLPYITLDRTTGTVALGWHDARNDNGVPGSGGTNTTPNDDAEYYATYSTNGGVSFAPNTRLSGGFSNAAAAGNGVDYGDYVGQDAYGGKFVAVWADNANCDGTNANGTLSAFDLYFNSLTLPPIGTPTPTATGTLPTATRTSTATQTATATGTATATATPNPCLVYAITTGTGTIVPGTTDIGNACDDCTTTIMLPFPVSLYGQTYTTAAVSSNGQLDFGAPDIGYLNSCLPDTTTTYAIFPYWDDQRTDVGTGVGIFTVQVGNTFYIEWRTTLFSGGTAENYEVVLTQGSPNFQIVYGPTITDTASETIGVQDAGLNPFTQYKCNTASPPITAGLQLNFSVNCATATATTTLPTSTATHTSTAGPTSTVTVTQTGVAGTATQTATSVLPTITLTVLPASATASATGAVSTATQTSVSATGTQTTVPVTTSTATSVAGSTSTATNVVVNTATVTDTPPSGSPTATSTACPLPFSDVPVEYYAYGYIKWAYCHGIISGYSDGTFRPENPTSRGQVAKMIVLAAGFPLVNPATPTFSDVPAGSIFYMVIETAVAHGFISGYNDGTYRPSLPVTRAQLAKMVVLARSYPLVTPATPSFSDVPPGFWAYAYIETARAHQIVGGYDDGTYRPNANTTRAQFTKFLYQAYGVPSVPSR